MCPVHFSPTGSHRDCVGLQHNPSIHPMSGLQVTHAILVCVINQLQQLALQAKKAIFITFPPDGPCTGFVFWPTRISAQLPERGIYLAPKAACSAKNLHITSHHSTVQ